MQGQHGGGGAQIENGCPGGWQDSQIYGNGLKVHESLETPLIRINLHTPLRILGSSRASDLKFPYSTKGGWMSRYLLHPHQLESSFGKTSKLKTVSLNTRSSLLQMFRDGISLNESAFHFLFWFTMGKLTFRIVGGGLPRGIADVTQRNHGALCVAFCSNTRMWSSMGKVFDRVIKL